MTPPEVNRAAVVAKKDSTSFIGCHWDDAEKCLVYQFSSGTGADEFKLLRETQGSPLRMAVQIHHTNLSSVREYRP
jgi:hypothetical protein